MGNIAIYPVIIGIIAACRIAGMAVDSRNACRAARTKARVEAGNRAGHTWTPDGGGDD